MVQNRYGQGSGQLFKVVISDHVLYTYEGCIVTITSTLLTVVTSYVLVDVLLCLDDTASLIAFIISQSSRISHGRHQGA